MTLKGWLKKRQSCRWMIVSGVFHAVLLGGLVLAAGIATQPTAMLRARLVTVVKSISQSVPERRIETAPALSPLASVSPFRTKKASRPSSPKPAGDESFSPRPALPAESSQEAAIPPFESASPSGPVKDDGAARGPAGPVGEGVARSFPPRTGPNAAQTDSPFAPEVQTASPLAQPEAPARGVFLIPGGNGSGTGQAGSGAADQGIGMGGGGTGGSGEGKSGQAGPGQMGGGPGRLASRGGGGGGGKGLDDLLRSIRHRIEQNKIYPDVARQEGIQGTVELRFRIAQDGSVEAIEILRSSGYDILDEASKRTLRLAAPYPVVPGWIRLPLSYRLDR